jgi:cytidylate kinase
MKRNSPFVITISRQLGSGGAYIGQQLAKKLNIVYADREIIGLAAQRLSVLEKDIEQSDEKASSFWQTCLQSYAFAAPNSCIPPQVIPTDRTLFETETEIIQNLAKERSAVIIGRCGYHILHEHPNHLSIFLHGNTAFRRDRMETMYTISKEAATKMIEQSDKERSLYNRTFAGKEWMDARQYDISLDTSKLGLDKSVEFIMKALE